MDTDYFFYSTKQWKNAFEEQGIKVQSIAMESYEGIYTGRIKVLSPTPIQDNQVTIHMRDESYVVRSLKALLARKK